VEPQKGRKEAKHREGEKVGRKRVFGFNSWGISGGKGVFSERWTSKSGTLVGS